jgi:hypothetical protein
MQRVLFNKRGHTCAIVVLAILLAGARTAQAQDTSALDSSNTNLLIPEKSNEGKWGYKDASGVYRIQPQFDAAMRFSEGLAAVALHKKVGYIDTIGTMVISPQFVDGEAFHEGLALVYTTWGVNIFGTEGWDLFRRAGYIDRAGKIVIQPRLAENARDFSEGVAAFQPGLASPGNAKWGYLDKAGEWAIKPRFEIASDFSEGLAAVKVSVGKETGQEEPTYKWGYIDHSGNFAIAPQFDGAMPFRNGIAVVSVRTQDSPLRRPKCVDKQGNAIRGCPPAPRPGEIPGKASALISPR